jgi:hypothetical protein
VGDCHALENSNRSESPSISRARNLSSGCFAFTGLRVVDEAEEDGESLFRVGEAWGMVGLGHLFLLVVGRL